MKRVSVDIMLSVPGVYVVSSHCQFLFVEVDAEGRCHQLEPHSGKYARDGELRPGGWRVEDLSSIDGPFARTRHTGG